MDVVNLTRMLVMERRFSSNIYNDIPMDRSEFRPAEGMMTAAEQLAHIGAFEEWLVQGLKHGHLVDLTMTLTSNARLNSPAVQGQGLTVRSGPA